jgi:DNA-binding transcriptional MerR regulator
MAVTGFTTDEICTLAGVPLGTLYTWVQTKLIVPSVVSPNGKGRRVVWSFRDIIAVRTVRHLREKGISYQGLRTVVKYIQQHRGIERPLMECWLLTDGEEVFLLDGKEVLALLRKPGQLSWCQLLDIKKTIDDIQAKISTLPSRQGRDLSKPPQGRPKKKAATYHPGAVA